MTVTTFIVVSKPVEGLDDPALSAFLNAVALARTQPGETNGSIAKKERYTVIQTDPVSVEEATEIATRLIDDDDIRIADKHGPAGAIPISDGTWLFFGYADVAPKEE